MVCEGKQVWPGTPSATGERIPCSTQVPLGRACPLHFPACPPRSLFLSSLNPLSYFRRAQESRQVCLPGRRSRQRRGSQLVNQRQAKACSGTWLQGSYSSRNSPLGFLGLIFPALALLLQSLWRYPAGAVRLGVAHLPADRGQKAWESVSLPRLHARSGGCAPLRWKLAGGGLLMALRHFQQQVSPINLLQEKRSGEGKAAARRWELGEPQLPASCGLGGAGSAPRGLLQVLRALSLVLCTALARPVLNTGQNLRLKPPPNWPRPELCGQDPPLPPPAPFWSLSGPVWDWSCSVLQEGICPQMLKWAFYWGQVLLHGEQRGAWMWCWLTLLHPKVPAGLRALLQPERRGRGRSWPQNAPLGKGRDGARESKQKRKWLRATHRGDGGGRKRASQIPPLGHVGKEGSEPAVRPYPCRDTGGGASLPDSLLSVSTDQNLPGQWGWDWGSPNFPAFSKRNMLGPGLSPASP